MLNIVRPPVAPKMQISRHHGSCNYAVHSISSESTASGQARLLVQHEDRLSHACATAGPRLCTVTALSLPTERFIGGFQPQRSRPGAKACSGKCLRPSKLLSEDLPPSVMSKKTLVQPVCQPCVGLTASKSYLPQLYLPRTFAPRRDGVVSPKFAHCHPAQRAGMWTNRAAIHELSEGLGGEARAYLRTMGFLREAAEWAPFFGEWWL